MTLFGQGDLFADLDGAEMPAIPAIDASAFDRATDHHLDEHSWITHVPGFVSGSGRLLSDLSTIDRWEQRRRWMYHREVDEPRLTAEYWDLSSDVPNAPAFVIELAATLTELLGVPYDRVWMNWYRDHDDGTGGTRIGRRTRLRRRSFRCSASAHPAGS